MGNTLINEGFDKRNESKYGPKEDDVIERTYRESKLFGDVYCAKNVEKYLRRFLSQSIKGGNRTDLMKASDYIKRMVEHNPEEKNEIIE